MADFALVFKGNHYPVPKKSVSKLFEHQQAKPDAKTYAVRSSVAVSLFEVFAASLNSQTKISVTKENAVPLWLLGKEFFIGDLESECSLFSVSVGDFSNLLERVCNIEDRILGSTEQVGELERAIESQEEVVEHLRFEVDKLKIKIEGLGKSVSETTANSPEDPTSTPEKSITRVEIPMCEGKSMEGIIW
jgi:regulator of replication initiation timing